MNPEVISAEPEFNCESNHYKLKICFKNDEEKLFDVKPYLNKGIFSELKDQAYFKQVRVAFGAVEWPNGQDFSKDTLYLLGK